ncbi:hypothetical protein S1361_00860 [Streptomyces cyanogenus]|uniref:Uncharacterized protein n=1 Tax=Streptomyces cyanogenus TaxID=80860 RepID=A0ABX7THF8_STRCY|nr:hypothetical protein S1361_00860 [Streptomyces cyanogenus]
MPSPKTTIRSDSTVARSARPRSSSPATFAVPVVGEGHASRTNHSSRGSRGAGSTVVPPRSSHSERSHPVTSHTQGVKRGSLTGPSPVDRGRTVSKHRLIT